VPFFIESIPDLRSFLNFDLIFGKRQDAKVSYSLFHPHHCHYRPWPVIPPHTRHSTIYRRYFMGIDGLFYSSIFIYQPNHKMDNHSKPAVLLRDRVQSALPGAMDQ
jgi:hypothetical protein